jgi:hypothetical protein
VLLLFLFFFFYLDVVSFLGVDKLKVAEVSVLPILLKARDTDAGASLTDILKVTFLPASLSLAAVVVSLAAGGGAEKRFLVKGVDDLDKGDLLTGADLFPRDNPPVLLSPEVSISPSSNSVADFDVDPKDKAGLREVVDALLEEVSADAISGALSNGGGAPKLKFIFSVAGFSEVVDLEGAPKVNGLLAEVASSFSVLAAVAVPNLKDTGFGAADGVSFEGVLLADAPNVKIGALSPESLFPEAAAPKLKLTGGLLAAVVESLSPVLAEAPKEKAGVTVALAAEAPNENCFLLADGPS